MKQILRLKEWISGWIDEYDTKQFHSEESREFANIVSNQHLLNNWHTEEDIVAMFRHLCNILNVENLTKWINKYPAIKTNSILVPVLVKPNINYSFAGIHELLCCVVTRTPFVLNAEDNQYQLLKFLCKKLVEYDNDISALIDIQPRSPQKCQRFIIHTEMNDSMTQYFSKKKSIIIEPWTTVAIIIGNETPEDLTNLGKDIFIHLGQSPRTLRKLYIPAGYDIKKIIAAIEPFLHVYQNNKYANNYDYHQSVFLMNMIPFLDNGFVIFKEDTSDNAPTGCVFYEYYDDVSLVLNKLMRPSEIENIICSDSLNVKTIKPGESHFFDLWDYFNKKDLIDFLTDNQRTE